MSAVLSSLRIAKKLLPTQAGAKRLAERFGKHLVCVRYRMDDAGGRRFTTVEIVVEARRSTVARNPVVGVRVAYDETALRAKLKDAGARWDPSARLWQLDRQTARRLKLTGRIIKEMSPRNA